MVELNIGVIRGRGGWVRCRGREYQAGEIVGWGEAKLGRLHTGRGWLGEMVDWGGGKRGVKVGWCRNKGRGRTSWGRGKARGRASWYEV